MGKWFLLGVIIVSTTPEVAFAQGGGALQLPGSLSVSVGTLAPSERGNVVSSVTTEQGFTPFRKGSVFVVGFANLSVRRDTDGLPWNRTTPSTAGLKVVSVTRAGVVQAVVGVNAYDHVDGIRASKAIYGSYWAGWRGDLTPTHSAVLPDAFPGFAYASSGFVTAAEPDNWITSVSVQQGATVFRYGGVGVIPFAGAGAGADSSGYNWNNRMHTEAGLKISREVLSGVIEVGMAQRRERNRLTRETRVAPVVFANLWIGWSPAVDRAR